MRTLFKVHINQVLTYMAGIEEYVAIPPFAVPPCHPFNISNPDESHGAYSNYLLTHTAGHLVTRYRVSAPGQGADILPNPSSL